ncbi:uncharacterized protein EI97DRAFT_498130 [Westerdykella ornata]|uniref:Uncharacterized protein n=1 Tax=Westerdykella ornata TaxID=318751 RepID=A0A6A6JY98_WESOR|nr:uncharacterized protein EI97DRAFT_498130 [Westerdykella ornata]KAF2281572.1 hypothetical protein EI97DRAFT_498130 [Westerdykella ornata]
MPKCPPDAKTPPLRSSGPRSGAGPKHQLWAGGLAARLANVSGRAGRKPVAHQKEGSATTVHSRWHARNATVSGCWCEGPAAIVAPVLVAALKHLFYCRHLDILVAFFQQAAHETVWMEQQQHTMSRAIPRYSEHNCEHLKVLTGSTGYHETCDFHHWSLAAHNPDMTLSLLSRRLHDRSITDSRILYCGSPRLSQVDTPLAHISLPPSPAINRGPCPAYLIVPASRAMLGAVVDIQSESSTPGKCGTGDVAQVALATAGHVSESLCHSVRLSKCCLGCQMHLANLSPSHHLLDSHRPASPMQTRGQLAVASAAISLRFYYFTFHSRATCRGTGFPFCGPFCSGLSSRRAGMHTLSVIPQHQQSS